WSRPERVLTKWTDWTYWKAWHRPKEITMKHIISALVENKPGVLAHVAGMFAAPAEPRTPT
ncbi:MAG: hypothetical protein ACYTEK_22865, partial [Planctomycetota bacterium]